MPKEYYNGEPLGGTYASAAQVIFNDLIAQYGASSVQEALEALISRKIETSDIVNVQTNSATKVPSAALLYAMNANIEIFSASNSAVVPGSAVTALTSLTLDPGIYILSGSVQYMETASSRSTGIRQAIISETASASGVLGTTFAVTALNGSTTPVITPATFAKLTGRTTRYLNGWQNAGTGTSLNATGNLYAVRLTS